MDDISPATPSKQPLYFVKETPENLHFQRYEHPLVSIIIYVFNNWETTRCCLVSILENSGDIPYEVIVADDGSSDETRNLSSYASNIKIVVNTTNLGFLMNCNNAARHATGRYLMFLNNDTIVQPGWLKPLVDLMEHDGRVGLAGPKLLYPDGRLQEAGGIVWQDGSGHNYGRFDAPEKPEYNYLKETDYVSGAGILVRKSLWDEIGGFDEQFAPAYYEDTDLAFEIRKRGFKVIYQPLSSIVHLEGISHGTNIESGFKAFQATNKQKFTVKWQKVLKDDHARGPEKIFKARDRSMKKKTLLFIDCNVPFYDQDAGSKSTFQYLQLMAEMGYNIKFIGDDFIEHQPYTAVLQQMGIEVLYDPWYQSNWDKWITYNGSHFDYIYMSRPLVTRKYLQTVKRRTSAKLFYCGHDLYYIREARRSNVEGEKSSFLSSQWKKIEFNIIKSVDISYFFSSFEVIELQTHFPNCIARKIPIFLFDDADSGWEEESPNFDSRNGLLFVGGFKHLPNSDAIKWFVREIFPLIKAKLPSIELFVVGASPAPDIMQLSGNGVVITGRLSEDELMEQYRLRRLVIAPLRYGAGVKGKIVEAMRYGVPTVTTSIGAEGIDNGDQALFIADEAQSFTDQVINAYTNPMMWNIVSNEASRTFKKYFSKDTARKLLEQDMPLY
jgi:GT2 family glycosyltransferase/glycosyltransferase involved in cell wall biosynthesis